MIKTKTNTSANIQFHSDANTRRTSSPTAIKATSTPMSQRLFEASSTTSVQSEIAKIKQAEEKLARDGQLLRQRLAEILGVSDTEVPKWYLDSNPHIIMRVKGIDGMPANPVIKHEMKQHFDECLRLYNLAKDEEMNNEYRAYALLDKNGHRSSIEVAHKQGSSDMRKDCYYKNYKSTNLMMSLLSFKSVIVTKWIKNIGAPRDLTINEDTADVVFPKNTTKYVNPDLTLEQLCQSLNMDYMTRPQSYVLVGLFNGKRMKDVVGIPFDGLPTASTTIFSSIVEKGDEVLYLNTQARNDVDARVASKWIQNGEEPGYFKWHSNIKDIFN